MNSKAAIDFVVKGARRLDYERADIRAAKMRRVIRLWEAIGKQWIESPDLVRNLDEHPRFVRRYLLSFASAGLVELEHRSKPFWGGGHCYRVRKIQVLMKGEE